MGMAASQARLLSITSRMSDNELRAQIINNSKMRLATDSSKVSEDYVAALNSATMMMSNYDVEGNSQYQKLNFNNLTAYSSQNTQYGLADANGNIFVTEDDADKFRASSNIDEFLAQYGIEYSTTYFDKLTEEDLETTLGSLEDDSYLNIDNIKDMYFGYDNHVGYNQGLQSTAYAEYSELYENMIKARTIFEQEVYSVVREKLFTSTDWTNAYNSEDPGKKIDFLTKFLGVEQKDGGVNEEDYYYVWAANRNDLILANDTSQSILDILPAYVDREEDELSKGYLLKDIMDITKSSDGVFTLGEALQIKFNTDEKAVFSLENNGEFILDDPIQYGDGDNEYITKIQYVLKIGPEGESATIPSIVNGNEVTEWTLTNKDDNNPRFTLETKYYKTSTNDNGEEYYEEIPGTASSLVYEAQISRAGDTPEVVRVDMMAYNENLYGNVCSYINTIFDKINDNILQIINFDNFVENYCQDPEITSYYNNYVAAQKALVNFIYKDGYNDTTKSIIENNRYEFEDIGWVIANMNMSSLNPNDDFSIIEDLYVLDLLFSEYGTPNFGWVDTENPSENAEVKAQWYTNLYNRMSSGYRVLEDGLASSNEWIQFALESGLVTMEQIDSSNNWQSIIYSNNSNITEVTDDAAVAKAEAEYNQAMNNIENKDKRYDMELKNIDTEHNSLQTEYDSVKSVIDKNIERSFKIYS